MFRGLKILKEAKQKLNLRPAVFPLCEKFISPQDKEKQKAINQKEIRREGKQRAWPSWKLGGSGGEQPQSICRASVPWRARVREPVKKHVVSSDVDSLLCYKVLLNTDQSCLWLLDMITAEIGEHDKMCMYWADFCCPPETITPFLIQLHSNIKQKSLVATDMSDIAPNIYIKCKYIMLYNPNKCQRSKWSNKVIYT